MMARRPPRPPNLLEAARRERLLYQRGVQASILYQREGLGCDGEPAPLGRSVPDWLVLIDGILPKEFAIERPIDTEALKHLEENVEPEVAIRVPIPSLCGNAPFVEPPVVV